ncbi:MAG: hypothetical protein V8T45_04435 [Oscillospiraceae bacterium]
MCLYHQPQLSLIFLIAVVFLVVVLGASWWSPKIFNVRCSASTTT